jgi:4-hydroxy-tetrahydrodipicolinate synthase
MTNCLKTTALNGENLRGNWGTLLLPVNEDDSIDHTRLGEELDKMIAAGVNGIYSNGTAGEFHNQTEDEFDAIQEMMAEKCHHAGMLFQIGASHPSPVISRERLWRTVSLKPHAFQVILPDWVAATEVEQIRFLKKMAEFADGIPLVLYNPPHAKTVLTPAEIRHLSDEIPSLIGVKVAGGGEDWFNEMKWSIGKFSVFVPGHLLASGMQTGVADGAYSNVACIDPKGAQWWWELMQRDMDEALDIQRRILLFFDECIVPFKNAGYSNPALDKLLAAAGGWSNVGTRLRWPYRWIDVKHVKTVGERAKHWVPEIFKS